MSSNHLEQIDFEGFELWLNQINRSFFDNLDAELNLMAEYYQN